MRYLLTPCCRITHGIRTDTHTCCPLFCLGLAHTARSFVLLSKAVSTEAGLIIFGGRGPPPKEERLHSLELLPFAEDRQAKAEQ